jgi:hypothetical protein
MTSRGLALAWVTVALAILAGLGYALAQWRALSVESAQTAAERQRLAEEVRLRDAQLAGETRRHAARLRDMQWSPAGADPSAFLARLAALAREKRTRITTVGPLERQSTPQFTRSWHVIQVVGPYREVRELIGRVERDRGVLQDVRIEPAPAPAAGRADDPDAPGEVQARFRLTALELSPQARSIVDRVMAAGNAVAPGLPPGPSPDPVDGGPARNPFAFAAGRPAPAPRGAAPPPPPPPRPAPAPAPVQLSAIVGFPGGFLAIIDNQIVRVGDVVNGALVERITETSVTLREPDGPARALELPQLGAPPPAAPRR